MYNFDMSFYFEVNKELAIVRFGHFGLSIHFLSVSFSLHGRHRVSGNVLGVCDGGDY
jgi:hypothetical protein